MGDKRKMKKNKWFLNGGRGSGQTYRRLFEYYENKVAELEKENAELKGELKKWKDEWQEQVQKATDEGYARTLQTIQLSKTKELLKKFMKFYERTARECYSKDFQKTLAEAEQFLKENSTYERIQKAKYNYTD